MTMLSLIGNVDAAQHITRAIVDLDPRVFLWLGSPVGVEEMIGEEI